MSLAAGRMLTHYEVLGPLGAGGMGEVYRAKDTRLEREVAIKVLPEELADDEERLRRFEREAKTLASLNHANVAGIHGVDQVEDVCFLALELVPGEDLATRLSKGALPVDEAIDVCRQIAKGLEAAHEAGVVHRDLKPANVRVTPDGVVKLLDFGLAKPIRPKTNKQGTTTEQSDSFLATEEGLVLGTPTYMSPEQARGKPVDRRTDIWAFGCVLYECLTGERAFRGESFTDVLAAIAGEEPDWSKLPTLPARVSELLRRTLTKNPRERLRDIGEARMQLALAASDSAASSEASAQAPTSGGALRAGALALAGGAVGFLIALLTKSSQQVEPADVGAAEERDLKAILHTFEAGERMSDPTISPTGEHVAWHDEDGLYVRALGELEPRRVHSERLDVYTWSPDGTQLAFAVEDTLWRVAVDGDAAVRIARNDSDVSDLTWAGDDVYFISKRDVHSAPVSGGAVRLRAACGEGVTDLHGFGVLPGGAGVVAVIHELDTGAASTIARHQDGEWVPLFTMPGEFLALGSVRPDASILFAKLSDMGATWILRATPDGYGPAKRLAHPSGIRPASMAYDGTGIYVANDPEYEAEQRLCWFQLDGTVVPIEAGLSGLWGIQLSHDRTRVLYVHRGEPWIHDLERGLATLALKRPGPGRSYLLPDGRIAFSTPGEGTMAYAASGKGEPELLTEQYLHHVADDGAVWVWTKAVGKDLVWSRDERCTDPRPLLATEGDEAFLDLSPDGAWMLYSSNRTGKRQVYLSRFPPSASEDWPVSASGGKSAFFLDDMSAIVFVDEEEPFGVFRVSLEAGSGAKLGVPEPLFQGEPDAEIGDFDGVDRFLGRTQEPPGRRDLVLSTEWREQLR